MTRLRRWFWTRYAEWIFREVPDDTCMCGAMIGPRWGCDNHDPTPMQGYAISQYVRFKMGAQDANLDDNGHRLDGN